MDADDRELFARSVRDATSRHTGPTLDAALADLGWSDALAADPRHAIAVLFELQGESGVISSALDQVMLAALGLEVDGVALPAPGRWRTPGRVHGERIIVDGLLTGMCDRVAVVAHHDEKDRASVAPTAQLELEPVRGLDPSLGLLAVRGDASAAEATPVDWTAAVGHGQRALAHELVGASRRMLSLAREHALERVQFGQPIAMFQAVRHRLAETLVAIETAEAALDAAWLDRSAFSAAMAKALAGRGARVAARHCQQVLAGIGFTTEHPLHRFVRRSLVLDQLLGSAKLLTKELGEDLRRTRQLPPLLPL